MSGCATQNHYKSLNQINEKEYSITKEALEEENKELDSLENKYNEAIDNGKTLESPEFIELLQKYESQKSKVTKYEGILKLNKKRESLIEKKLSE